jgi:hypothetical protein
VSGRDLRDVRLRRANDKDPKDEIRQKIIRRKCSFRWSLANQAEKPNDRLEKAKTSGNRNFLQMNRKGGVSVDEKMRNIPRDHLCPSLDHRIILLNLTLSHGP